MRARLWRRIARGVAALAAALAIAALAASPAGAVVVREIVGLFGSAAQPSFNNAAALAVEQGSGELYVVDVGTDEVQSVTVDATEGQFRLIFDGQETADINHNASGTTVKSRLTALAAIGPSDLAVSGGPGGAGGSSPYVVTFQRGLGGADIPELECVDGTTALGGGSGCTVETTTLGVNHQLERYNADGTPSPFAALGSNVIDGRNGADQTPQDGVLRNFGPPAFAREVQVAIDESGTATDGNVYVTDSFLRVIDVFSADGEYLGQLSEFNEGPEAEGAAVPLGEACGIAVDESGSVYVADFGGNSVHKYVPAANPPTNADNTANYSPAGLQFPCALAAGAGPSAGSLFVTRYGGAISKLHSEGAEEGELDYVVAEGTYTTVSVDPESGFVLAAREATANEYDASGPSPVLEVQSEPGSAVEGLAANGAAGTLYLGLAGSPNVEEWGTSGAPVSVTGEASELAGTTARLNGRVNPRGTELEECVFEYVEEASYQPGAPDEPGDPGPYSAGEAVLCAQTPAGIGAGSEAVPVHADIVGLNEATVYHFRLRARSSEGEGRGEDESFQTLGPAIEATWAEDVELSEATLKAEIDPEGKATGYRFEYGAAGPCSANPCTSVPVPDGAVGEDSEAHEVSALLRGLAPGIAYHYRAVATNADAVNEGPDRLLRTYAPPSFETDCPNQAFRVGPSAALPDCRAYEMVSPTDKGGGDIVAAISFELGLEAAYRESSHDGERVVYASGTAFGDAKRATNANQYLSGRDPAAGWSTHGLNPPLGEQLPTGDDSYNFGPHFRAFSDDLCRALLRDDNEEPLTPDGLEGHTNWYVRENCGAGAGTFTPLTRGLEFPTDVHLDLKYGSFARQGNHILFGAGAPLAVDAGPPPAEGDHQQIYDYDLVTGELRLVSVLPGGAAATDHATVGGVLDSGNRHGRHAPLESAVSDDGARIFWTSGNVPQIYARVGVAKTVQLSTGFGVEFLTATADGSIAVYRQGTDLFEFDLDLALAEEEGGATPEAAREAATSRIAGEAGGVVGASEDLSYLYFTSREALDDDPNSEGDAAIPGELNVYLRREGNVAFVATVAPLDAEGGGERSQIDSREPLLHSSKVTADGRHLAFMSIRPLTGYDNTDAATGEAASEVFRYEADTGELLCVSCKPSGARPEGGPLRPAYIGGEPFTRAAAWLPTSEWATSEKRALSLDGDRILFNAYDDLALRDVNGAQDVYQWEAPGTGSCGEADPSYSEQNGGCLSLISSGRDPEDSELLDASADGADVFFTTSDSLDEARDPGSVDLYDARVGGGFPAEEEKPPCVGDACQQVPAAPEVEVPASAIFEGSGNVGANLRCRTLARRATRLSRQARRMVRASRRAQAIKRKRRQRRRGRRLKVRATRLRRNARRCRQIERRAGR